MTETLPATIPLTPEDAELPDLPTVSIYGDLAGSVTSIPTCMLSLVVRIGRLDDDSRVLVPMTEIQLSVSDIEDGPSIEITEEEALAAVVPLENAAFIIAELASDLEDACEELGCFASATLRPEPRRMERCAEYLRDARGSIDGCLTRLAALSSPN